MDTYDLVYGKADCFDNLEELEEACQDQQLLGTLDIVIGCILVLFLFSAVVGNCLVNGIFRTCNIIRRETSVSHVCLSHVSFADLIYSVFVMPLSLALILSNNRFTEDATSNPVGNVLFQIVGFTGDVCKRASLLFITIVTADHMAMLYLPTMHQRRFTMVSIKTAVGASWVACIVFGILPFMSNDQYTVNIELLTTQWSLFSAFTGIQRLWGYVVCMVVPILAPGIFITVSNLVLTVKLDLDEGKAGAVQRMYDPFSKSIRAIAMRIANTSASGSIKNSRMPITSKRPGHGYKKKISEVKKASLGSLRPIATVYIVCNFLWFVDVAQSWTRASSTEKSLFHNQSYLQVVHVLLSHVPIALTPLLHFLCSWEMKQALKVLGGGYNSVKEYKQHRKIG